MSLRGPLFKHHIIFSYPCNTRQHCSSIPMPTTQLNSQPPINSSKANPAGHQHQSALSYSLLFCGIYVCVFMCTCRCTCMQGAEVDVNYLSPSIALPFIVLTDLARLIGQRDPECLYLPQIRITNMNFCTGFLYGY